LPAPAPPQTVLVDARALQGPSARRGIGRYAAGILGGLSSVGFEFSVLVDGSLPNPELPGGVKEVFSTRRRWHGRLAGLEDAVALREDLRRIRPALYHSLYLTLPRNAPCPVVVTVHDLIPWAFGGWRMLGERFRYSAARRLLPRAELVIAVSESTARDLRRLAGVEEDRIRVIHEGLDPRFQPRPGAAQRVAARWGQERPYFLFVGALDVRKDPRGLLTAWDVARAAGADGDLLIAGEPGRQAPPSMGAARMLGKVTDEELEDLLSAASCMLFPTLYEGFGLPALEAMGCGCPVVAYSNSSLPEVMGEAGALVPTRDAAGLGRAAARLILDAELRRTAIKAGLARARAFTWPEAARRTVKAYQGLLR
jgi:glycosyltransferase involved in cell wall biosynthesis